MFSDPQTLTIATVATDLARIKSDGYRSEYSDPDEVLKMTISHQESASRTRRMVRVDKRFIAANPLTAINEYKNLGVYIVIDEPEFGFSTSAIDDVVQALLAWCTTANITKVLGQES